MVRGAINPRYYDTIEAFGAATGVPMILNTSFNLKGEPLVNTPRDALRTFFSSGLDALIMNNILLRKPCTAPESLASLPLNGRHGVTQMADHL
jgi:carbamoyltransferase